MGLHRLVVPGQAEHVAFPAGRHHVELGVDVVAGDPVVLLEAIAERVDFHELGVVAGTGQAEQDAAVHLHLHANAAPSRGLRHQHAAVPEVLHEHAVVEAVGAAACGAHGDAGPRPAALAEADDVERAARHRATCFVDQIHLVTLQAGCDVGRRRGAGGAERVLAELRRDGAHQHRRPLRRRRRVRDDVRRVVRPKPDPTGHLDGPAIRIDALHDRADRMAFHGCCVGHDILAGPGRRHLCRGQRRREEGVRGVITVRLRGVAGRVDRGPHVERHGIERAVIGEQAVRGGHAATGPVDAHVVGDRALDEAADAAVVGAPVRLVADGEWAARDDDAVRIVEPTRRRGDG